MLYQSFYAQDDILRENNPSFKISPFLTNKEALTVLCSVRCKARTTGSGQNTKEVQGGTRDVVECFSLFLEQYNRVQSRLLNLFYEYKESVKFPTHSFLIFKTIFIFFLQQKSVVSMFYTRIKHAFSTNQSARYI